jgi:hypothetical protein
MMTIVLSVGYRISIAPLLPPNFHRSLRNQVDEVQTPSSCTNITIKYILCAH